MSQDESLEDSANLPDPDIIAAEIVEDLQAALAQLTFSRPLVRPLGLPIYVAASQHAPFAEIANDLKR